MNRSDDGGLTYGPAVLAAVAGNTTGNIAVDQNDGTVYFVYQGPTPTSNQVRVAIGHQPGSVALAWFGATAADSEDGLGLNNDNANWKVFFSETFDATALNPTFYTAVASDHFVHGSNISLGGLGGSANRNLGDFFQLAI